MLTKNQVETWVNDPSRTETELRWAADFFTGNTTGTKKVLRTRILTYLDTRYAAPDEVTNFDPTTLGVVNPAPVPTIVISPATLPAGVVGTLYDQTLSATGFPAGATLVWSLSSGSLPAGLTMTNGRITGTPTAAETKLFRVKVTDGTNSAEKDYSLVIDPIPATQPVLEIMPIALPNAKVGAVYDQQMSVPGYTGATSLTWRLSAGSLPAGLTMANGRITGTPTATGTSTFTVQASDGTQVLTKNYSMVVDPASVANTTPVAVAQTRNGLPWWAYALGIGLFVLIVLLLANLLGGKIFTINTEGAEANVAGALPTASPTMAAMTRTPTVTQTPAVWQTQTKAAQAGLKLTSTLVPGALTSTPSAGEQMQQTATAQAKIDDAGKASYVEVSQVSDGRSINWPAFKSYLTNNGINNPYDLINELDGNGKTAETAQFGVMKIDHPQTGWTVSGTASVVWTGWYNDNQPLPEGVYPVLVDGRTGVYVVAKGVTVPNAGGEIPLTNWISDNFAVSPVTDQPAVDVSAPASADAQIIVNLIKTGQAISNDQVFTLLDAYVGNHPEQRLRAGQPGNVNVKAYQALVWTQPNAVPSGAVKLLESNGKALFLATETGVLKVNHAFSGVALDKPMNENLEVNQTVVDNQPQDNTNGQCTSDDIKGIINAKPNGIAQMYTALDKYNTGWQKPGEIQLKNGLTLIVTKDSFNQGAPVILLDTFKLPNGEYRSLYLATADGVGTTSSEYFTILLCEKIDPVKDLTWWGK